jgi:hypothetical protein
MGTPTKLKRVLLLPAMLAVTMQAEARLDAVYMGCSCGAKAYMLDWDGPWEHPNIYLNYSTNGAAWEFYAGYLPHTGSITSPVYNMYYMMMSCTGQLCAQAGFAFVPNEPCNQNDG